MSEPGPKSFPPPKPRDPAVKLVLPRRRPTSAPAAEVIDASAAARESINALFSASRTPFGAAKKPPEPSKLAELERTLRQLELSLADRERVVTETEARLVERERDIAESEALLSAREQLFAATKRPSPSDTENLAAEKQAMDALRAELERQEEHIKEQKQWIREREQFLDEAEAKLFEKVQAQQEKENELEQREEDLRARDRRVREREARFDTEAAAALKSEEEAARLRDEFRE